MLHVLLMTHAPCSAERVPHGLLSVTGPSGISTAKFMYLYKVVLFLPYFDASSKNQILCLCPHIHKPGFIKESRRCLGRSYLMPSSFLTFLPLLLTVTNWDIVYKHTVTTHLKKCFNFCLCLNNVFSMVQQCHHWRKAFFKLWMKPKINRKRNTKKEQWLNQTESIDSALI